MCILAVRNDYFKTYFRNLYQLNRSRTPNKYYFFATVLYNLLRDQMTPNYYNISVSLYRTFLKRYRFQTGIYPIHVTVL